MTERPRSGWTLPPLIRRVASGPPPREEAPRVVHETDPRAPLFFLSYARTKAISDPLGPPRQPNRRIIRFFNDLSETVAELVSRPAGADPGFMDQFIPDGSDWAREILTAVGTCQVFVALLSVPYVRSPWCGTEWHAFTRRTIVRHAAEGPVRHRTGIIPVTWTPVSEGELPRAVNRAQRFSPRGLPDPDIAARYEQEGVLGLIRLGLDNDYEAVMWRLGQSIAEFHHAHRVEPRILDRRELRNAF